MRVCGNCRTWLETTPVITFCFIHPLIRKQLLRFGICPFITPLLIKRLTPLGHIRIMCFISELIWFIWLYNRKFVFYFDLPDLLISLRFRCAVNSFFNWNECDFSVLSGYLSPGKICSTTPKMLPKSCLLFHRWQRSGQDFGSYVS